MAQPFILNNFQNAIADSPELGFADMRNLDLDSVPGQVRLNLAMTKESSTTITDLIKWMVTDPATGYIYALGDTGKVYRYTSSWAVVAGNSTTSAAGQGLAIFKNYLWVARTTGLDVMKLADDTWTTGFQSLTSDSHWHPMLVGQDDILYGGNGNTLFSVSQLAGQTFDPSSGSTYSFNGSAVTLPTGNRIKCLSELGRNIMMGTIKGTAIYGGVKGAEVFPWDRSSTSFNLPIDFNDFGVHQMINVNNTLVAVTGYEGTVHISNGSTTGVSRKLPDPVTNLTAVTGGGAYLNFYPGAVIRHRNKVFFGVSRGTGSSSVDGLGVWSTTISETPQLNFENQISTNTTTGANALNIGSLLGLGSRSYRIGWQDNSTYGIDVSDSNYYTSYAGYVRSAFTGVGTNFQPATYEQLSFQLAAPLASGQGVRIRYRTALSAAFTTIGTFDYATYGAIQSLSYQYALDAENLQVEAALSGGSSETPKLKEVRLE